MPVYIVLMDTAIAHHPDIATILQTKAVYEGEFIHNCLGVKTRVMYRDSTAVSRITGPVTGVAFCAPNFNEEYFEWIDLLQAVKQARNQFTMIELGAGYGRWSVYAALALRRLNPLPYKLIAVEPEPTHYQWMLQHFRDNDINPDEQVLLPNPVAAKQKRVPFHIGNPAGWYGQYLGTYRAFIKDRIKSLFLHGKTTQLRMVKAITLNAILEQVDHVDLLDLDIQGEEYNVLRVSINELNKKVKRIHIGTHKPEIDSNLRLLFNQHQWENNNDYPCFSESTTPYGVIKFNDGVQTWLNPRYHPKDGSCY